MTNNKPFDLTVEDLKASIYNDLNTSGLPMSVLSLVIKEINKEVNEQYVKHIQSLIAKESSNEDKIATVTEATESSEIE